MAVPNIAIVPDEYESFDLTVRLTKDLRAAAAIMTPAQQRILVDMYYQVQENRKASANQLRAAQEEPNAFLIMMSAYLMKLEGSIKTALDQATNQSAVSRWAKSMVGIGPVLAAGLAAHIDIRIAKTASAIWRFAGLDPTSIWRKGEKRPWNAQLKTLSWKVGDSFCKFHNHPQCYYGRVYAERKALELARNFAGAFAEQAATSLAEKKITDKDLRATYEAGRLPAGRLELRARRVAVKLFLSHYFEVAYTDHYGEAPPKTFILAHDPERHTQYVPPPLWDGGMVLSKV